MFEVVMMSDGVTVTETRDPIAILSALMDEGAAVLEMYLRFASHKN